MKELEEFDKWIHNLDLEWDVKGQKDLLPVWLKAREDAAFHWSWNRAARQVTTLEKKAPLDEAETAWMEWLDVTVKTVVELALSRHDESSDQMWRCMYWVYEDFKLLARASRLHLRDPFLDKLRAEYDAGRFPHGIL